MAQPNPDKRKKQDIGFEPNDKCPYCRKKVRITRQVVGKPRWLIVFHWFTTEVCLSDEAIREYNAEKEDVPDK